MRSCINQAGCGVRPEVEVLAHVDLLEYVHEPLLFSGLIYLVIERDRDGVGAFAVVDVVTSNKCDHGTLRDEDHVPPRGELDEAYIDVCKAGR